VSGTLSVVTDYRYRGITLSAGDPALQASVVYDDPGGAYAGLFASNVAFAISSRRELQLLPYAGYARRLASGLAAEIGAEYAAFTGPGEYNYPEFYVGLSGDRVNARLYYAPRYFGRDSGAFYAELNAAQPVSDRVRVLAHAGVLVNRSNDLRYGPADRTVFDGRLGLAVDFAPFTLQASWVGVSSSATGYPIQGDRRNTVVAALSCAF
jgi:uncharacterized protein (TIGR02001 family)